MDAEFDYDTTNLQALREELKLLNTAALEAGLISIRDGWPVTPRARQAAATARARRSLGHASETAATPASTKTRKKSTATTKEAKGTAAAESDAAAGPTPDTGKAGARRLLTMTRRTEGDGSPAVPGTDFTEAGVVRLLAHLRKRHARGFRFLQRLNQFLTRPVPVGTRTAAGISVERLQTVSRQLLDVEANGWLQFRNRVERRNTIAAPDADQSKPARQAKSISQAKSTRKTKSAPKAKSTLRATSTSPKKAAPKSPSKANKKAVSR